MKILITGASGLVGKLLIEELYKAGITNIAVLTRDKDSFLERCAFPIEAYNWDYRQKQIDENAFNDVTSIIHLAGENVAGGRWTAKRKQDILESRELGTKFLVEMAKKNGKGIDTFISASAVGIYGNRGPAPLTEDDTSEENGKYLVDVCKKWEEEASNFDDSIRTVMLRIGVVLSDKGGALAKMLPPFKMGGGGILGNGKQYMSWIHIKDLVSLIIYSLKNKEVNGPVNAVAPYPVTNHEFTKTLGNVIRRPTIFPVPEFVVRTIFGDMATILVEGQNVKPKKALEYGFQFEFSHLNIALSDILSSDVKGEKEIQRFQFIKRDLNQVFDFFSDEKNLETITPPFLNFKVLNKNTETLQQDTLINYSLKLHGIPLSWTSKIEHWVPQESFVDVQVKGPYQKWHHTHNFYPLEEGTLIEDKIIYKIPGGIIGRLLFGHFINRDLRSIFDYRRTKVKEAI